MQSARILKDARLRAGLTQRELAGRVGRPQSSIARWESGRVQPSLELLAELVRACGFELETTLLRRGAVDESLFDQMLSLTPAERLDQLVRTVAFIHGARYALAARGA